MRLEAKPGKEDEVLDLLIKALHMASHEATTPLWFALRISQSTFAVFDAFAGESERQAHLEGRIATTLLEHHIDLFSEPPSFEQAEIPGYKLWQQGMARAWELYDDEEG